MKTRRIEMLLSISTPGNCRHYSAGNAAGDRYPQSPPTLIPCNQNASALLERVSKMVWQTKVRVFTGAKALCFLGLFRHD